VVPITLKGPRDAAATGPPADHVATPFHREEAMAALFAAVPQAVVITDTDLLIGLFSPAAERLFGLRRDQAAGRSLLSLLDIDAAALVPGDPEQGGEDSQRLDLAGVAHGVDGRRIPVTVTMGRARAGGILGEGIIGGGIAGGGIADGGILAWTIAEVSERAAPPRGERRRRKLEVIGREACGVAHDFRNIMTLIAGNLEMIEERRPGAAIDDLLRDIGEAAALGSHCADLILTFARERPPVPITLDLGDVLRSRADLIAEVLGPQIRLTITVETTPLRARIDPGPFTSALLNLALNARDAMPDGGAFTITAGRVGPSPGASAGAVRIVLADTGTGMSADTRRRAFEPFFTTKSSGRGIGLGLCNVRDFLERLGGHVALSSAPGVGTRVELTLPALPDDEAPRPGA